MKKIFLLCVCAAMIVTVGDSSCARPRKQFLPPLTPNALSSPSSSSPSPSSTSSQNVRRIILPPTQGAVTQYARPARRVIRRLQQPSAIVNYATQDNLHNLAAIVDVCEALGTRLTAAEEALNQVTTALNVLIAKIRERLQGGEAAEQQNGPPAEGGEAAESDQDENADGH